MQGIYRLAVSVMLALHCVWLFFPWFDLFDQDSVQVVIWAGYGALINDAINSALYFAWGFGYLFIYVGLMFFLKFARLTHLLFSISGVGLALLYGVVVQRPAQASVSSLLLLGDGFLIAIGYFTSVGRLFSNRSPAVN